MRVEKEFIFAVCAVVLLAIIIFTTFALFSYAHAGKWQTEWNKGSETPYTTIKSNDTGVMLLSKTVDDGQPMLLLGPHGPIEFPRRTEFKLVIGVDKEVIYTGEAIVLSSMESDSKAYVAYPSRAVVVHMMAGNQVTFILAKSLGNVAPVEFQFGLNGSQEALAPIVGQNL